MAKTKSKFQNGDTVFYRPAERTNGPVFRATVDTVHRNSNFISITTRYQIDTDGNDRGGCLNSSFKLIPAKLFTKNYEDLFDGVSS